MKPLKWTSLSALSALLMAWPSLAFAQMSIPPDDANPNLPQLTGFEKPYEYERQANGYDPEGVEYKENQSEDFQVVFITSLPFTALASYGLTGLASLATRGTFDVNGDYFLPFLIGTGVWSTTIACVSVLTNPYPAPSAWDPHPGPDRLALRLPVATLRF